MHDTGIQQMKRFELLKARLSVVRQESRPTRLQSAYEMTHSVKSGPESENTCTTGDLTMWTSSY